MFTYFPQRIVYRIRPFVRLLLIVVFLMGAAANTEAAEVLVLGDTRLSPVAQVVSGIEEAMGKRVMTHAPGIDQDRLAAYVKSNDIRVVIALGHESIQEALKLPTSITVLYDMVLLPPETDRPNTAGMYLGTPISAYVDMISSYLPNLQKIGVIGSPQVLKVLGEKGHPRVTIYQAGNAYDFVKTIKTLDEVDALLLLPDISILSKTALEESYLFSFRNKVPLLGISKKHVRLGSLFALEFDPQYVGRRLGTMAVETLRDEAVVKSYAMPSKHFNLYINRKTAQKMGIDIPSKMLEMAKAVYP